MVREYSSQYLPHYNVTASHDYTYNAPDPLESGSDEMFSQGTQYLDAGASTDSANSVFSEYDDLKPSHLCLSKLSHQIHQLGGSTGQRMSYALNVSKLPLPQT